MIAAIVGCMRYWSVSMNDGAPPLTGIGASSWNEPTLPPRAPLPLPPGATLPGLPLPLPPAFGAAAGAGALWVSSLPRRAPGPGEEQIEEASRAMSEMV